MMAEASSRRQWVRGGIRLAILAVFAWLAWVYSGYFSRSPNAEKLDAALDINVQNLAPGDYMIVKWDRRKLYVWHRTKAMLANLTGYENQLNDPDSEHSIQPQAAKNAYRSINPYYLVVFAQTAKGGCEVDVVPAQAAGNVPVSPWYGGFRDECKGTYYDLAGRSYRYHGQQPNLEVPDHQVIAGYVRLLDDD
jgi:ubiquinol-cytochrome c reductase iron-sulfur subunit